MNDKEVEKFVKLLTENQSAIFAFIRSLVPNVAEAKDIFQETNLVIWRKRKEFSMGTKFTAWAFKIAHFQVLAFLKKTKRQPLFFEESIMDQLIGYIEIESNYTAKRLEALNQCLEKLPRRNKVVLGKKYYDNLTIQEISREVGQGMSAIKMILLRTRQLLFDCITRELRMEV